MRSVRDRRMMAEGISRIERELEIDRFLKGQMKLRILLKTLFSKAE